MRIKDKKAKEKYLAKLELVKSGANVNPDESKQDKIDRIERAKKDFAFFVKTYFAHYITDSDTQEIIESPVFHISIANKVKREKDIKALLRWGRGLAKSVLSDLFIPLWLWINEDIFYMVLVGNNFDKAKILLSDLQAEFEANELLKYDYGEQKMLGSWEDGYFITKNGFIAKALGMGQSPRGLRHKSRRPDYIVCDDLEDQDSVKNPKRQDEVVRWIEQDLLPTMDGSRRRYLHANNNSHPRTIQEELRIKHPDWHISRIDAYNSVTYEPAWSEKYSKDYYKNVERELGIIAANAEYNNKPHIAGKIFKEDQIQWAKRPALNHYRTIVGHWDIAYAGNSTSDYNAVRIWGLHDKNFWYIDSFVKQTKMREAAEWMCTYQKELPPSVIIHWRFEAQFWNDEVKRIIHETEQRHGITLNIIKVQVAKTNKYDRILRLQPYYQNSRIFYDSNKKAHADTQTGLEQLYGIEPGYRTHDDAPDSDEQAISYLETHIRTADFKPRMGKMNKNTKRAWR